jgi:hypothetical protein
LEKFANLWGGVEINSREFAKSMDQQDALKKFREKFVFPTKKSLKKGIKAFFIICETRLVYARILTQFIYSNFGHFFSKNHISVSVLTTPINFW